jgi:endo-1,4-beta-D-glucanase Y
LSKIEIFQEILNFAKKNLRAGKVKRMLLATVREGRTVFHVASAFSKLDPF